MPALDCTCYFGMAEPTAKLELGVSVETMRVIGFVALFVVVYAILYKPVLAMLEKRQDEGPAPAQEPDDAREEASAGGSQPAQPRAATPLYRDAILLSALVGVFVADQATKYVVKTNLDLYQSWPQEGLVRITYGTNSGTAFGLFPDQTAILVVTSLLAIGFIYYFYRSHALPGRLLRLAIGLQLGGAFGNLVDRVRLGSVVDFIDVGWWPIFNVADSSIVTGIGLLMLIILSNPQKKETDPASRGPAKTADAPPSPETGRPTLPPDPSDDPHLSS